MSGFMFALQSQALPSASSPVIWTVAIVYFVVVAAIGVWATRRTRTAKDFFVAGGGIGLWPAGLSAMSATISGFAFIGGPGLVYTVGTGAMYLMLPAALTGAMGAWVLAKRMRLLGEFRGLITVPDALRVRYNSRAAQGLSGISILIAIIGYMATNVLALGLVIDAIFGTGLAVGIWFGTGITLAYSVAGGILAGIYTDVFQGALMALASVLVFAFALKVGSGMEAMSLSVLAERAELMGPWGTMGPIAALSFFFVFGMGSLGQPHVVHKFYMIRDPKQLKWLPLLVTGAILMTVLLYYGVGLTMRALVARGELAALHSADLATPTFLLRFTPTILAGLVFAGVAAAIMSTVNAFMNIGAAVLTHDLPAALARTPRNELLWGRIYTVVISVLAGLLAQFSGTLVAFLGIFGWGLFASTLVPALAFGLNWQGATREGSVASITTGLVVTLTLETMAYFRLLSFPVGITVSGLSLVLSMLVFFLVSSLTRRRVRELDPIVRLVMEA